MCSKISLIKAQKHNRLLLREATKEMRIHDRSKVVVLSDTHLTHHFNEQKARLLERIIARSEHVILNGDFWDGWLTSFDLFVRSPWRHLFPLLRKKKTVYIYGNHDASHYCDKRTSLFSHVQQDDYLLHMGKVRYHLQHGHQFQTAFQSPPVKRDLSTLSDRFFTHTEKLLTRSVIRFLGLYPTRPLSNRIQHKINLSDNTSLNLWHLVGHTHSPHIDISNRFANSGFIRYGHASYLIISATNIRLKTEWYT